MPPKSFHINLALMKCTPIIKVMEKMERLQLHMAAPRKIREGWKKIHVKTKKDSKLPHVPSITVL